MFLFDNRSKVIANQKARIIQLSNIKSTISIIPSTLLKRPYEPNG